MKKNKFLLKNNIFNKYLDKGYVKKFEKKFDKTFKDIIKDTNNPKKTLNILSNNFEFNFKFKDLERFRKYKEIVIVGMGGSILGAEAINEFLKIKIKKKNSFF